MGKHKGYHNNPELVETLAQGNALAKDLMDSLYRFYLETLETSIGSPLNPDNNLIQFVGW